MNRRSKRIFDLALSVLGLFLLAPVLMLTGLAIWLEDGRPILFVNVLRGEMSLVGPRPLALEDLKKVNDFATDDQVGQSATSSVPGLTGIWQLYRSGDDHYEDKVWMDRFYFEHQSWKLDLDLLAKTFLVVLFGRKQSWQRKLAKKNSRVTRNERS